MRATEIVEGGIYEVNVSGERIQVRVAKTRRERGGRMRALWHCTRLDNGRALPKARESSAIHPRSET